EVEHVEHPLRERREAGLRVGDVPVPRRDLRQHREDRVPEVARTRDQVPGLARDEPVRLRVVELTACNGQRQHLEVVRIHLVVGGHHARDVHGVGVRALVASDDRGADAAVPVVPHDLDACVPELGRTFHGGVAGAVVDDVDAVDERGYAAERGLDQGLLVVRRHDDRNALPVEHQRRTRSATPSHTSAASTPRMRPTSAATTSEFRLLRAVIFCGAARTSTDGFSTTFACRSSWLIVSRSASACASRCWRMSLSETESAGLLSDWLMRLICSWSFVICALKFLIFCPANSETFATTASASPFAEHATSRRRFAWTLIVTSGVCPFFEMLPATFWVEIPPRMSPGFASHWRATFSTTSSECAIWRTVLGFVCAAWSCTFPLAEYGWPR